MMIFSVKMRKVVSHKDELKRKNETICEIISTIILI